MIWRLLAASLLVLTWSATEAGADPAPSRPAPDPVPSQLLARLEALEAPIVEGIDELRALHREVASVLRAAPGAAGSSEETRRSAR